MSTFKKVIATATLALGIAALGVTSANATPTVSVSSGNIPAGQETNTQEATAYGNGHWVMLGDGGVTLVSTDGKTWTLGGNNGMDVVRDVTYGDGKFVAVGDTESAVSTDNGATWLITNIDHAMYLSSIAYGNGHFVAVDFDDCNGRAISSTDGSTWTYVDTADPSCWNDIAFGDGKFMVVGEDWLANVSTDGGLTWTHAADSNQLQYNPTTIAYGNGRFMVLGDDFGDGTAMVATTTDGGTTWWENDWNGNNALSDGRIRNLAFGDGVWIGSSPRSGGANTVVMSSDNGQTWTSLETFEPANYYYQNIAFGNGLFVLAGNFNGSTPIDGRNAGGAAWIQTSTSNAGGGSLANTGSNDGQLLLLTGIGLLAIGLGAGSKLASRKD